MRSNKRSVFTKNAPGKGCSTAHLVPVYGDLQGDRIVRAASDFLFSPCWEPSSPYDGVSHLKLTMLCIIHAPFGLLAMDSFYGPKYCCLAGGCR